MTFQLDAGKANLLENTVRGYVTGSFSTTQTKRQRLPWKIPQHETKCGYKNERSKPCRSGVRYQINYVTSLFI